MKVGRGRHAVSSSFYCSRSYRLRTNIKNDFPVAANCSLRDVFTIAALTLLCVKAALTHPYLVIKAIKF